MKTRRVIALILVSVVMLSLCACSSGTKTIITSSNWVSDYHNEKRDTSTVTYYSDYKIFFYEDGSCKRTNNWRQESFLYGWQSGPEENSHIGTWKLEGDTVITTVNGNETKYTFSHDKENNRYLLVQEVPMAADFKGITYYCEAAEQ